MGWILSNDNDFIKSIKIRDNPCPEKVDSVLIMVILINSAYLPNLFSNICKYFKIEAKKKKYNLMSKIDGGIYTFFSCTVFLWRIQNDSSLSDNDIFLSYNDIKINIFIQLNKD